MVSCSWHMTNRRGRRVGLQDFLASQPVNVNSIPSVFLMQHMLVTVELALTGGGVLQVAIKFLQRGERLASVYVEREIVNHSSLLHPHIVHF